jgi:4'-phosphopantetheinyl transferase
MRASAPAAVTVWHASVSDALARDGSLATLDADERARGGRMRQPGDRDRFHAARILLRHALSHMVDGEVAPSDWRFREGANRKPVMQEGLPPVHFNISHAGDFVAVALSEAAPVGVDVEPLARDARLTIVDDVLAESERTMLAALDETARWEAFARIWTLKEACAKAAGTGVDTDFAVLEVLLEPPRVVSAGALAGTGESFALAARMLSLEGDAYAIAAAAIVPQASEVPFQFRAF